MDTIAIMHDGADCCRERAAVMPYAGGSGVTDQESIERGRLAEGRSSVGGRSASVRDGRPHRQRLAAEPADVLTNRDSGNSRSCRLASRECLAPRECENPFDDVRRFKLREENGDRESCAMPRAARYSAAGHHSDRLFKTRRPYRRRHACTSILLETVSKRPRGAVNFRGELLTSGIGTT
ncbi:hypothetical protein, partial [Burkholderia multivorans]|uniref:hypothetical protein n=1 Tax=Burkholderia multivorans TaxID=87883 RepID=UPI001C6140E7